MSRRNSIKKQTEQEIATMRKMIRIYCKGNKHAPPSSGSGMTQEKAASGLCPDCQKLLDYALFRIDTCAVKETKTFCSECTIHCYQPEMREKIREVMRYSGPRMIYHSPVMALRHVMISLRSKRDSHE